MTKQFGFCRNGVAQTATQVPLPQLQAKYSDVNPFLIKKWERIFTLFFDRNCSHQVDWGDFYLVVREVRNIYGAESEQSSYAKKTMEALFQGLCKIADKDHDKLISIFEWIDLLKKVSADVKKNEPKWFIEYLTFLFKLFDVSADGVLDLAEYTDGMSTYGHNISDSHAAFKRFAVDDKGNSVRAIDLKKWHIYFHQLFFSTDPKDLGNNLFGTMD